MQISDNKYCKNNNRSISIPNIFVGYYLNYFLMNQIITSSFADTKSHYKILDGLRGLAAVMVVAFHILETFTGGNHSKQIINHG